jgi:broad specificity phosphatase PhoE
VKLYFVRHGETEWNRERRAQGHALVALSEIGRIQAERVARSLAALPINTVLSSDLPRAIETAEAIARPHGIEITGVEALRERHVGIFQGLTWEEIGERHPDLRMAVFGLAGEQAEGGESTQDLWDRMAAYLDRLRDEPPTGDAVIVSHGGALRAAFGHLLGMNIEKIWRLRVDNCSISEFEIFPEGAIANRLNDVCHLDGLLGES